MIKMKSVPIEKLPNAAHYNFYAQVNLEIAKSPDTFIDAPETLPQQFSTWPNEESTLMAWVKKNAFTEPIREADRRTDRSLTALKMQVRALEYSVPTRRFIFIPKNNSNEL
jgi:hypothetical protein